MKCLMQIYVALCEATVIAQLLKRVDHKKNAHICAAFFYLHSLMKRPQLSSIKINSLDMNFFSFYLLGLLL